MPKYKDVSRRALLSTLVFPLFVLGTLAAYSPRIFAQAPDSLPQAPAIGSEEKIAYEARAQTLLANFVEKETQPSFGAVVARYASGERISEAHRMLAQLLAAPQPFPAYTFGMVATYLFGRQNLTPALAAQVKATLGKVAPLPDFSEHEMHYYFAALLLAAETWPQMTAEEWFNGKTSAQNLQEAQEYFNAWLEKMVTEGQCEYDSPQALPAIFSTLAVLREFTRDENLRQRLSIVQHLLMIDFAAEHMGGLYGGAHTGTPLRVALGLREAPSAGFSWLYLGVGKLVPTMELLCTSLSSYEIPTIIQQLAKRRDPIGGFVHQERKRRAPSLRYENDPAAPVCKYTYVSRNYILGSIPGGALSPGEQQSWGLVYRSRQDPYPILFLATPATSGRDLAKFRAAEPRLLQVEARQRQGTSDPMQAFVGASNDERIFQHRNVLIGLYGAPDSMRAIRLMGFFSNGLDTLLQSNQNASAPEWLFAQAGDTYIALMPLQPYHFETSAQGRWLISEARRNGFILEVSTPIESGSFAEFQRRLHSETKIDRSHFTSKLHLKYTTAYGDIMEFTFNPNTGAAERVLNGKPVSDRECVLFSSPLLKHFPERRRVVLRFKNEWLELDCDKWEMHQNISTITEELKAQD